MESLGEKLDFWYKKESISDIFFELLYVLCKLQNIPKIKILTNITFTWTSDNKNEWSQRIGYMVCCDTHIWLKWT